MELKLDCKFAMAIGLLVVATSAAVRGLKARIDEDIIIADSPKRFAEAVINLIPPLAGREVNSPQLAAR